MAKKKHAGLIIVGGLLGVGALGAVALVASQAGAAEPKDAGKAAKGERGKRHGFEYEGCHFLKIVDPDAIEDYLRSNKLTLIKWLPQIDSLREDPEPLLVDILGMMFPECKYPPPGDWAFEGLDGSVLDWDEFVERAREEAADIELAQAPGVELDADTVLGLLTTSRPFR